VRVVALIKRVVGRQFVVAENRPLNAQRVEPEVTVRRIVESILLRIEHRLADKGDGAPVRGLPVGPNGIERLPDIGAVARRHEALLAEGKVLPPDAELELAAIKPFPKLEKTKLQIERIPVNRRDRLLAIGPHIFDLCKDTPVAAEVHVDIELQSLQQIGIGRHVAHAEAWRVAGFEALSQARAHGQVSLRVVGRQRYVLQPIQRLGSQRRISQNGPVFLPTIGLQLRAHRPGRR
jgi:molybdate transport system ATP-binding protein